MANIDTSSIQNLIGAANEAPAPAAKESTPKPAEKTATMTTGTTSTSKRPEKPGDDYKWDAENKTWVQKTPEEIEKSRKLDARREASKGAISNLHSQGAKARGKLSDFKLRMKHAISKRARIAAYVVNNDSKYDLVARKREEQYNLEIVNKAPSAIKAVVITIPTKLASLQSKDPSTLSPADMMAVNDRLLELAESDEGDDLKSVIVKPWDELAAFIQNETEGYLHEDENIFTAYMDSKGKLYNTVRDIEGSPVEHVKGSFLYIRFNTHTDAARTFSVKHSLRSKIVAPGNYIVMKKWDTAPIKGSYDAGEAANMRKAYLDRFCTERSRKVNGVATTQPAILKLLSIKSASLIQEANGTIVDCAFFPTTPDFKAKAWIASDAAKHVNHWYNRTRVADGDKKSKGIAATVSPKDIELIVKEEKKSGRFVAVTHVLGKSDYQFDSNNFPKIALALGNKNMESTLESINAVLQSKKGTGKKGTGKPKVKTFAVSGSDLQGLSLDEITKMLAGTTA